MVTREDVEWAQECLEDDPETLFMESVLEAADGCSVDPDGTCPHGRPSPLVALGMI